jgi:hypothetical protein
MPTTARAAIMCTPISEACLQSQRFIFSVSITTAAAVGRRCLFCCTGVEPASQRQAGQNCP